MGTSIMLLSCDVSTCECNSTCECCLYHNTGDSPNKQISAVPYTRALINIEHLLSSWLTFMCFVMSFSVLTDI